MDSGWENSRPSKNGFFCHFPYTCYRKSARNKQVLIRTPRTHLSTRAKFLFTAFYGHTGQMVKSAKMVLLVIFKVISYDGPCTHDQKRCHYDLYLKVLRKALLHDRVIFKDMFSCNNWSAWNFLSNGIQYTYFELGHYQRWLAWIINQDRVIITKRRRYRVDWFLGYQKKSIWT